MNGTPTYLIESKESLEISEPFGSRSDESELSDVTRVRYEACPVQDHNRRQAPFSRQSSLYNQIVAVAAVILIVVKLSVLLPFRKRL